VSRNRDLYIDIYLLIYLLTYTHNSVCLSVTFLMDGKTVHNIEILRQLDDRVIFCETKIRNHISRIQQSVTQAGRHYTTGAALDIK